MIDSHCHLADGAFAADAADVVARARAAGVAEALCIVDALDAPERARAAAVVAQWPAVRLATGVHPHRAHVFDGRTGDVRAAVSAILDVEPAVRALGEVGLDYHYDFSPPAAQREVFAHQVALAADRGLPLVIHTREADADTVAILREAGRGVATGVFHCFSGDVALARSALDLGFCVSFSGIVTFPKATAVHDAARFVPDDRLLLETDCPYLAPVPLRGKRNEPAWVTHIAVRLGALRGTTAAEIGRLVTDNYRRVFAP